MKTLDERLEEARHLRKQGYNCAQCVTMVFDDITDAYIDKYTLGSLIGGMGTGVGGMREICGTVTAMAAIEGLLNFHQPSDRAATYGIIQGLADEFLNENGSIICRELKTEHRKPCMELIEDAIAILHNNLTIKIL